LSFGGSLNRHRSDPNCCPNVRRARFSPLDVTTGTEWSGHTKRLFNALGIGTPEFPTDGLQSPIQKPQNWFGVNLQHAAFCNSNFGRDLLATVDPVKPILYSPFKVDHFVKEMKGAKGFSAQFFAEPECLFVLDPK
jgi:hypothetical protein